MDITMREVARLAGVSRPVVSAVFNNSQGTVKFTPEVRERVLKVLRETGYVPNIAAQQLKGISTPLIGLFTVHSRMGLITILQAELISVLQKNHFEVLTAQASGERDIQQIVREFKARNVIGVVVLNFAASLKLDCPAVYCPHGSPEGFDVGCDTRKGAYLAAAHMIEVHGRGRFVYMSLEPELTTPGRKKYEGMRAALREHGLSVSRGMKLCGRSRMPEIVNFLKKHCIDTVFCSNDALAAGLIPRLLQYGIRVPEDIAVIGFDGYVFGQFCSVPLATVVQPVRGIAEKALELLQSRIDGKIKDSPFGNIALAPEFRPGASCGCEQRLSDTLSTSNYQIFSSDY